MTEEESIKNGKINIQIARGAYTILEKIAKSRNMTPEECVKRLVDKTVCDDIEEHPKRHFPMKEITIRIPKRILEFLEKHEKNLEEYLQYSIVHSVRSDIDAGLFNLTPDQVITKYDLRHTLNAFSRCSSEQDC